MSGTGPALPEVTIDGNGTIPAQRRERRVGASAVQNTRELNGVVHGYFAEIRVGYRPGIGAQAKDRGVLTGERPGEL